MKPNLVRPAAGALAVLAVTLLVVAFGWPHLHASAQGASPEAGGQYKNYLPFLRKSPPYPPPVMLQRLATAEASYPAIRGHSADSCALCHAGQPPAPEHPAGQYNLNNYGGDFRNYAYKFTDPALERIDSDGDTIRNGDELRAGSNPGDVNSVPTAPPTTPPPPPATTPPPGATSTPRPTVTPPPDPQAKSYAFQWSEGSKLQMVEFWNDASRVACEYDQNPWPGPQFAAERAFVLGARQVLRDEWNIGNWISANGRSGSAHIHGAEDNCPNNHHDFPPHVHIFYVYTNSSGWQETNSHAYTTATGKINELFVIPQICGGGASYTQPADQWLDVKDETCSAIWQQRYTSSGDFQLRRNASSPVYTLRGRYPNQDVAGVDVYKDGALIYSTDVTQWDPIDFRMVAQIRNYGTRVMTTETWQGNPGANQNLTSHTTSNSGF